MFALFKAYVCYEWITPSNRPVFLRLKAVKWSIMPTEDEKIYTESPVLSFINFKALRLNWKRRVGEKKNVKKKFIFNCLLYEGDIIANNLLNLFFMIKKEAIKLYFLKIKSKLNTFLLICILNINFLFRVFSKMWFNA